MKRRKKIELIVLSALAAVFLLSYFIIPFFTKDMYDPNNLKQILAGTSSTTPPVQQIPDVAHVTTPKAVKAIYMSACAAGTQSFRDRLVGLIDTTELNSIVIDVKDYSGQLSYVPADPDLKAYVSTSCYAPDMKDFIAFLHSKNIYVIGRVTTFQDPFYTKLHPEAALHKKSDGGIWKDKNGLAYIDPGSKEAWDHVVAIARDATSIGFDEINFDYIRYPSDGNVSDIAIPPADGNSKSAVLTSFFDFLNTQMNESHIVHSADIFGMTTTAVDDMGIGQLLEAALPDFDYVDPMVYPSHYPATFNGWANPNAHPYDLIKYVMGSAVNRAIATSTVVKTIDEQMIASTSPKLYSKDSFDASKLRPWLQDFNLGTPAYGPTQVRDQIQATYDAGLSSWLLWDAANKYTPSALEPK